MFVSNDNSGSATTTSYRVVLPFYLYAAIAFLVASILLFLSSADLQGHYFHPHTLAITHTMALGWGTMIILGASHQLVPVLIEGALYSNRLAHISFLLAAAGIPLLVYGFYVFDVGWPTRTGALLLIGAIGCFLVNLATSMVRSKKENIHALSVFTATLWLLATAVVGLLLLCNFSQSLLPAGSLNYLSLHAHMGIVGWFLLLVTGVGSRLIPMFLISKYTHAKTLWWIYMLINTGLLAFVFLFLYTNSRWLLVWPLVAIATAVVLFGYFCFRSYQERIRKKVDEPMQLSLLSVLLLLLPILFLLVIMVCLIFSPTVNSQLVIAYGFIVFFGWITAIILGMTFKTLPFIVWNKVYHHLAGKGKTPNPKELFAQVVFNWMGLSYIAGFVVFTAGLFLQQVWMLQTGSVLLLITAVLYNWNVMKLLLHKSTTV
ncbi:MAG: cytochrome C oxidase subunit I [Bacteroidetes bacterium]|nr:cytochrome C oxidase subunit I [Bacteroidota bacterium]